MLCVSVEMGAWVSYLLGGGGETTAVKETPEDPAGFDDVDPATGLTPRQKQAVVQTWALVQPEMRATGIALLIA